MKFCSVAVEAPIFTKLTYRVPDDLENLLQPGDSVRIPLGRRIAEGVVTSSAIPESDMPIKNVIALIDGRPRIPTSFLSWIDWVAEYYAHPIGQVHALAFPALSKSKKRKQKPDSPLVAPLETPPPLTPDQSTILEKLAQVIDFKTDLLFGVTGSGKTEVYLRRIEQILTNNKSALVLVPEIALTPQLYQRFRNRFGDEVAILHSQLTDRQRTDHWHAIVQGKKRILLGARSALFCPIPQLGFIVVDEEHEPSYKQEEKLKYHARDAAIMRAKFEGCPILLGSATPSLESWHNAKIGKYGLYRMKTRFLDQELPKVQVVDLKNSSHEETQIKSDLKLPNWISLPLFEKLKARLEVGQQSALFLNRRGMAPVLACGLCGHRLTCPNCSVTLTQHGKRHTVCHYCDFADSIPVVCPDCKEGELKALGLGTEKIEGDLIKIFPNARLIRIDRDEIQSRSELEEAIQAIEQNRVDIIVGTQMIAKGLDFPNLTLVGVVLADIGFGLPDFRASERSFQLLTQVAGRAGRHRLPGDVVLQAYHTDHPSVQFAINHDFEGFAEQELRLREELRYPPFGRLTSIRFQGPKLEGVRNCAQVLRDRLSHWATNNNLKEFEILGPSEAPLSKLRGKHRYHLLLKASSHKLLGNVGRALNLERSPVRGVKISVDVDPGQML